MTALRGLRVTRTDGSRSIVRTEPDTQLGRHLLDKAAFGEMARSTVAYAETVPVDAIRTQRRTYR